MPKHKIIIDCDQMQYPNTGLYYYCLNLGQGLKRLVDASRGESLYFFGKPNEVKILGEEHLIEEADWPGISRKMLLEPRSIFVKWYKRLMKHREVWHAPFQSGRVLPVANDRLKVLLTIHDLNELHEPSIPQTQKQEAIKRTQLKIDQSTEIVCISEFCKSDVIKHLDLKGKPIHVIHNGTNSLASSAIQPRYVPHGRFLFTLGYVNRKKNFHVLIPLLGADPSLELIIAGKIDDPDYLQQMQRSAQQLGALERLHVLGPVSEEDKAWYYQNCYAFMFPSIAEGFGLPVTEAMHFGKPLFLSTLTSLPEIGGDVAFYFPTFQPEAMKRVFSEGMERYNREDMATAIQERGATFNWDRTAMAYMEIYRSLLSGS